MYSAGWREEKILEEMFVMVKEGFFLIPLIYVYIYNIYIYTHTHLYWLQHVCFLFVRNNGGIGQPNSGKPPLQKKMEDTMLHPVPLDAFSVLY